MKPCPSCGCDLLVNRYAVPSWYVRCMGCGKRGPKGASADESRANWNAAKADDLEGGYRRRENE